MSAAQDRDYQPKPDVLETPERVGTGFDLRVHIKDAKTGEIIRYQPYSRHCVGRSVYYERPVGSGNLYYEDGKAAGRWVRNEATGEHYADTKAKHVAYAEPQTRKATPEAFREQDTRISALERELEALRKERDEALEMATNGERS